MWKKLVLIFTVVLATASISLGCSKKITEKNANSKKVITTQKATKSADKDINNKVYTSDAKEGKIIRYVKNGKIGYVDAVSGKYITKPIYTKASAMEFGLAVVKKDNHMFYINEDGKRISKNNYIKAFSFSEAQGNYARAKIDENTWSIIDRNEKILLKAKLINKLPYATNIATGITKKGKAFSYAIGRADTNSLIIYKEYDAIEKPHEGKFAMVEKAGKKGVINFKGENYKLIDTLYQDINFELYPDSKEMDTYIFRCKKSSGQIDVIVKKIY